MVDKIKAIELREEGLSYEQIAKELNCSIVWCKKNLKAISKNTNEKGLIKELTNKAQSKDMLTNGEIIKSLRTIYPNDFSKEKQETEDKAMKRFKQKIKVSGDAVIRPYWMIPSNPSAILYDVLREVHDFDLRMHEAINNIRSKHGLDETYIKSLMYAINNLTQAGNKGAPIAIELNRLEEIANELEKRNA